MNERGQNMKPMKYINLILSFTLLTSASHSQSQDLTPSQQAYIKASNTGGPSPGESGLGVGDNFGWSVASSGDTMAIGAPGEDSNATGVNGNQTNNSAKDSGAAYVFVRDGTNWVQQAYLKASNTVANDQFGWKVAISGELGRMASLDFPSRFLATQWLSERTGTSAMRPV